MAGMSPRLALGALAAALAVFVACPADAGAQRPFAQWEQVDFRRTPVARADVERLPLDQLQRLRGLVFGRHGRIFDDADSAVAAWLRTRPWYRPDSTYTNARLNATERASLDLIREQEAQRHPHIQNGDMRWWRDRVITRANLEGSRHFFDWEVLEAEVEAIHGKVFWRQPGPQPLESEEDCEGEADASGCFLQYYFNARYWYRPRADYRASELSATERANMDTIALARISDNGGWLPPGMMHLFAREPVPDSLLRRVGLYDLRILRNEVYARRGRRFTTPWLKGWFARQAWYQPRATFSVRDLTPVDSINIARILAAEDRWHERLSSDSLEEGHFDGLYPEAARRLRNEIFARHGRPFTDPALRSYFASLPWYREDPAYTDARLTPTERYNVASLVRYEARARRGERFTVG
jgi:hypothetical protein